MPGRKMMKWQRSGSKNLVHEAISRPGLLSLVALVIQFHSDDGPEGIGVTQQKVHVLLTDARKERVIALVLRNDMEHVLQSNLAEHSKPIIDCHA